LFYANFRANFAKTSHEFDVQIAGFVDLPPGVPSLKALTERAKDILGFHPSELTKGFASESLIAVTLAPERQLIPKKGETFAGAFWLVQAVDDHADVRRTLNALVERLSEESSTLFWKDEHNLVGAARSGANMHLRLEKSTFRLGIGDKQELARVLGRPNLLEEDLAYQADTTHFDEEMSAVGWLDLGRLLAEPDFAPGLSGAERHVLEPLKRSLTLTGASRPIATFELKQFNTGDIRLRSLNFPTALLLFAVGSHGSAAPDAEQGFPNEKDADGPPPAPVENSAENEPDSDGTFPLPPL
jgi:hypothetical protein